MSLSGVLTAGGLFGIGAPLVLAASVAAAPLAIGFLGGIAIAMSVNYLFTGSWVPDYF